MQSYVPMTTLLAWWWLGERFAWRTGLAIAVSFAGVLVLGFDPMVLDRPMALVLMLMSAAFLAVGTVLMKGLRGLDVVSQQGWTAVFSVLPLLAISAWLEPGAIAQLPDGELGRAGPARCTPRSCPRCSATACTTCWCSAIRSRR